MLVLRPRLISTLVVLILLFAYSIVRYHVLRGTPWEHFPLYISNKAIAISSIAFIALSYNLGPMARFLPKIFVPILTARKYFGLLGFGLASVHAVITFLIFNAGYYQRFFASDGKLNLEGELSMIFGILAFFIFSVVALASVPGITKELNQQNWQAIQRLGYLGLILVFLHVLAMGLDGWLKPAGWPGGLLPISLLAAIVVAFTLLMRVLVIIFPRKVS